MMRTVTVLGAGTMGAQIAAHAGQRRLLTCRCWTFGRGGPATA